MVKMWPWICKKKVLPTWQHFVRQYNVPCLLIFHILVCAWFTILYPNRFQVCYVLNKPGRYYILSIYQFNVFSIFWV
jgi:hypothetical protein